MSDRRRLLVVVDSFDTPSAYVSGLQFEELFRSHGFQVTFVARHSEEVTGRMRRFERLAYRMRMPRLIEPHRLRTLAAAEDRIVKMAASADVVLAIKVPSLELHQRIRELGRPRLFMVFNDAFWLPFSRPFGWTDLEKIFQASHAVICLNEFTAEYVRRYQSSVFVIPDAPQVEDFDALRETVAPPGDRVVIGWLGTPITATSLFKIWEPLEELARIRSGWTLRLVGVGHPSKANVPRFEQVPFTRRDEYDRHGMLEEVLKMDIGIFPLFAGEESRARGFMKAAVYMAGGAAVVAQRYADNAELIEDGVNGYLAGTDAEWLDKLTWLVDHPVERRAIADKGLETVRHRLSRSIVFDQLLAALESV